MNDERRFGEWIDCKERMPDFEVPVLAYISRTEKGHALALKDCEIFVLKLHDAQECPYWEEGGREQDEGWQLLPQEVSHWLPLPQAPKEVECAMMTDETRETLINASIEATKAVLNFSLELAKAGYGGSVRVCDAIDNMIEAALSAAVAQDKAVEKARSEKEIEE